VLSVLAVALFLAGCGTEEAGVGGGSTQAADTEASPPVDDEEFKHPPAIFLESAAGRQRAVEGGTSCISWRDPSSDHVTVGMCSDGFDPAPLSLSTVRPGEEIRILLEEGEVVRSDSCSEDDEQECIGTGHVHPLGCGKEDVAVIPFSLGPVTTWRAELAPGAYEVDYFINFVAPGRGGDVSGALGLLVDEAAPLEIVQRPGSVVGCVGPDPVRKP